jgi:hypothetical protein
MQINNSGNQEKLLYADLTEMGRVVFVGWGGVGWGGECHHSPGASKGSKLAGGARTSIRQFMGKDGFDSFNSRAAIRRRD